MTTSPPSKPSKAVRKIQAIYHPTRPLSLWQDAQHDQGEVRIEIIPLIDVIFCILTFFILGAVGLSRQQAISLDLPKASTGTPQMREMFVVSLDDLGQLYVEKQPVNGSQMMSALQNYHQYNPSGLIVLHASRNASYNDVVQLLDMLRSVGGDRVALATLPGESAVPSGVMPMDPANPLGTPGLGLPGGMPNSLGSPLPTPGANGLPQTIPPGSGMPTTPNSPSGLPNTLPGTIPAPPGAVAPNSAPNLPRFAPDTVPQPPAPRPNTP